MQMVRKLKADNIALHKDILFVSSMSNQLVAYMESCTREMQ